MGWNELLKSGMDRNTAVLIMKRPRLGNANLKVGKTCQPYMLAEGVKQQGYQ